MNFRKIDTFDIFIILLATITIGLMYVLYKKWNARSFIEGADSTSNPNGNSVDPTATTGNSTATTGDMPTTGNSTATTGDISSATTSDWANISGGGNANKFSQSKDMTYAVKFESIESQIKLAVEKIKNIYSKIPMDISDVKPGTITTIPYNAAIKSKDAAYIKINVVPKVDKLNNAVYYTIGSSGKPVIYTGIKPSELTATFNTTCASKNKSSECDNEIYSIVFPACQWIIDMRLPMGPRGDKGDPGPQGEIGPVGGKGDKGDVGFIGNWGKP